MMLANRLALGVLAALALLGAVGPSAASALPTVPGGTPAPGTPQSGAVAGSSTPQRAGGSAYDVQAQVGSTRPVVAALRVPRSATAGNPPHMSFQILEAGVGTVAARVTVSVLSTRHPVVSAALGWVHTGRNITVSWPHGATLTPGAYQVSLSAHDHHGVSLLREAHSSGVASLTILAPVLPVAKAPSPPAPSPAAPVEAGVQTPAETVAAGAVFPVAGVHSFGGPENRFGAPREGHVHEGQDVLSAEGTPEPVPLAGTISSTSYQSGGAGYYAVEHTTVGFDFLFAHCEASSLLVSAGQAVTAGQALCKVGQSGDATAPHLHFEIWVGGWQAQGGHPIDPLPYLEAWEHASSGA